MKNINITSSQRNELLRLYWELREAILNLNGLSKGDFEFGELFSRIGTILDEIRAPTMMITSEKLTELQQNLMKIRALIKRWIGFEVVIGSLDSISSIIEMLLLPNHPVIQVSQKNKRELMELYAGMKVEIRRAYEHT